jgi:hypothetical protein
MVKSEYFEKNNMDDTWVCNWCGSEQVYEMIYIPMNAEKLNLDNVIYPKHDDYKSNCSCNNFESPLTYSEWCEEIFEETMGNKEEYLKILDGSRM